MKSVHRLFHSNLLICTAATLLTGCAMVGRNNILAPESPLAAKVVKDVEADLAKKNLLDKAQWKCKDDRDDLIQQLIFLSNYRFSRYEAGLVAGKAIADTAIDEIIFGLSSAAAFGVSGGATQILGLISSGMSFSRTNVEKNFFNTQAMPVLIRKMRALRQEKYNQIAERLKHLQPKDYSVYEAITDVLEYHHRGTLLGAIQALSDDTAIQELRVKGGTVTPPPASQPRATHFKLLVGKYEGGEFQTSKGPIKPPPPPPLPQNKDADVADILLLDRNRALEDSFKDLTETNASAALMKKDASFKLEAGQKAKDVLAAKILDAAGFKVDLDGAQNTLQRKRLEAQDEKKLKNLEDAYKQYITVRAPKTPQLFAPPPRPK